MLRGRAPRAGLHMPRCRQPEPSELHFPFPIPHTSQLRPAATLTITAPTLPCHPAPVHLFSSILALHILSLLNPYLFPTQPALPHASPIQPLAPDYCTCCLGACVAAMSLRATTTVTTAPCVSRPPHTRCVAANAQEAVTCCCCVRAGAHVAP